MLEGIIFVYMVFLQHVWGCGFHRPDACIEWELWLIVTDL